MTKKNKDSMFKHADKIVTWIIIWWALWWLIYTKRKTLKSKLSIVRNNIFTLWKKVWYSVFSKFWKVMVFWINLFKKKKK